MATEKSKITVTSLGRAKLIDNAKKYTSQEKDFINEVEWVLSPSLAYEDSDNNEYGVYVHSSARNFNKFLEQNDFLSAVESNLSQCLNSFIDTTENIKNQVKPDPKMRTKEFLDLFKKTEQENLFNGLKDLLMEIKSSPLLNAYEKFKKSEKIRISGKAKDKKQFISIKTSVDGQEIKINTYKIQTGTLAYKNLAEALGVNKNSKGPEKVLYDLIQDAINSKLKDVTDEYLQNLDELVYQTLDMPKIVINGIEYSLPQCFAKVQELLNEMVNDTSGDKKPSFDALMKVADFNSFKNYRSPRGKRGNFFSDIGFVFEDLLSYLWGKESWNKKITNVGAEKKIEDYNTTDLSIDLNKTIEVCNLANTTVNASIKHTVNFEKEKFLRHERLAKILGPKTEIVTDLIKQYKYFILNYSLLSNAESRDRMYSGSVNQKSSWGHNTADVPLLSLQNVVNLYNEFTDTLGRIFLTMSLVGDLYTHSTEGLSEDLQYDLPKLLITKDYAVFTYDILDRLLDLIELGGAEIQAVPYMKTSLHSQLVRRKAILTRKKQKGSLKSYDELVRDSEVQEKMKIINRSAFVRRTENKNTKKITETEGIKITSTVDLAMIVEKYRQGTKR